MKASLLKILTLTATVGVVGSLAQTDGTAQPVDPGPVTAVPGQGPRVRAHVPDAMRLPGYENLPTEVQDLVNRFQQQRQDWVANRRQLLARLQDMTAEEREAAIAELRELQRTQVREQRELARQIRDEMRELRNARRRAGGGGG